MKKRLAAMSAAACLAGVAATPALAGDNETFVFRVEAASLQTQADVASAYERLSGEALRYCRALGLSTEQDLTECRVDVIANVVEAVGDARLSTLHRSVTADLQLASAG